jgi:hypothetical protein
MPQFKLLLINNNIVISCFGRHIKLVVLAVSAVVSNHQSTIGPCGGYSIRPNALRGINGLKMMINNIVCLNIVVIEKYSGPAVSAFGVQSGKLSNVPKGQSPDG